MDKKLALDAQFEDLARRLPTMSLDEIGRTILDYWPKVNYAARPYLDAMLTLDNIGQNYGMDTGKSIVVYFLGNANTWRGEPARLVKRELNNRIK